MVEQNRGTEVRQESASLFALGRRSEIVEVA